MLLGMRPTNTPVIPAPPNPIASLLAGFDTITNHLVLVLFPIALDLLIWLGPHFGVRQLVEQLVAALRQIPEISGTSAPASMQTNLELLQVFGERFNMMSFLRSYPIGIPSLMSGLLPVEVPGGAPAILQVNSFPEVVLSWLVLTLVGLAFGTFFFTIVSQAALDGKLSWANALREWPRSMAQVLLVALILVMLIIAVSVPSFCALSLFALGGLALGQFAMFILLGFLIWLLFPLVFSTHGIFVLRQRAFESMLGSVRLTRLTMPGTGLFLVSVVVIAEGLDLVWRLPKESSWLATIGISGHAFITTGLIASSFVYFRRSVSWIEAVMRVQQQVRTEERLGNNRQID